MISTLLFTCGTSCIVVLDAPKAAFLIFLGIVKASSKKRENIKNSVAVHPSIPLE